MATTTPAPVRVNATSKRAAFTLAAREVRSNFHVVSLEQVDRRHNGLTPWLATYAPSPTLADLARQYGRDVSSVSRHYAAMPYLQAMATLPTADLAARYGADDAASLLRYALSNLTTWRGATAREWKATAKAMLATHDARMR